jgi:hypothetical protein
MPQNWNGLALGRELGSLAGRLDRMERDIGDLRRDLNTFQEKAWRWVVLVLLWTSALATHADPARIAELAKAIAASLLRISP